MNERTITKTLSANDTGETGGTKPDFLSRESGKSLSFFPTLDGSRLNPRAHLQFEDQGGNLWEFAFIYYNNRFFGGTRNEYRLTRMTKYIRETALVSGDDVVMRRQPGGEYSISYKRAGEPAASRDQAGKTVLKLGSGWKVIDV